MLAIIPARANSKRLPEKNLRILRGKTLLAHAIEHAIKSEVFTKICVTSEDDQILSIAGKYREVTCHKRPQELSGDEVETKEVCKDVLQKYKYESFCLLLPTSPLRDPAEIAIAAKIFLKEKPDALMSATEYHYPPQKALRCINGLLEPKWGGNYMKQAQELEPLFVHDGSFIFMKTDSLFKNGSFYKGKIIPYFIPKGRSVDIDTELDLKWAEFLLERGPAFVRIGGFN